MKSQDLAFEACVLSGETGTFDKTLGITEKGDSGKETKQYGQICGVQAFYHLYKGRWTCQEECKGQRV